MHDKGSVVGREPMLNYKLRFAVTNLDKAIKSFSEIRSYLLAKLQYYVDAACFEYIVLQLLCYV